MRSHTQTHMHTQGVTQFSVPECHAQHVGTGDNAHGLLLGVHYVHAVDAVPR